MKRRAGSLSILVSILVFGTACSTATRDADPQGRPTSLRVENSQFEDLTVFLVMGDASVPIRLGVVDGLTTRDLRVPPGLLDSSSAIMLRAETRGAGRQPFVTRAFHVDHGQSVFWTVRSAPSLSTLIVRRP